MNQRPFGVTLIAILAIIVGVIGIVAGIPLLSVHAGIGLGILAIIVGVVNLVFGIGALQLKPWAWVLGVVLEIVALITAIVGVIQNRSLWSEIISIVIAAVILYYLFTPHVQRAFGRHVTPTTT
jgi:hypothetical protein